MVFLKTVRPRPIYETSIHDQIVDETLALCGEKVIGQELPAHKVGDGKDHAAYANLIAT